MKAVEPARVDDGLYRQVETFLAHEGHLMDTHQYDAWLQLWTQDLLYWVPCNDEDIDPSKEVSIIYDHRDQLEDRLFRLKGRHAHAQSPKSRLVRVVSNVRILSAEANEVVAGSTFVLGEVRANQQEVIFGRCRHVLERDGDVLRIKEKKVFILSNDIAMRNLVFIL